MLVYQRVCVRKHTFPRILLQRNKKIFLQFGFMKAMTDRCCLSKEALFWGKDPNRFTASRSSWIVDMSNFLPKRPTIYRFGGVTIHTHPDDFYFLVKNA